MEKHYTYNKRDTPYVLVIYKNAIFQKSNYKLNITIFRNTFNKVKSFVQKMKWGTIVGWGDFKY